MAERPVGGGWLSIALGATVCVCVGLVAVEGLIARRIRELALPQVGVHITPLSGRTTNGEWVVLDNNRPCHVVRFASDQCPFSKADDPRFRELEGRLHNRGCDSAILAPSSAVMPTSYEESSDRRMFQLVQLGFLKSTKLSRTPTTMIFDQRWRLMWLHEGVLNRDAAAIVANLNF